MMQLSENKKEFIRFMLENQVLQFGDFVLKSGRRSPFFMNAGAYVTGSQLRQLGRYYATAIHETYGEAFDVLFGPAYKGIPLAVATAMAFAEQFGVEVRYCSNRKEEKDHGDAGILLGSPLQEGDRVVIIEDVTTSGKSIAETYPILQAQGNPVIVGMMVSLDRMEKGEEASSALQAIKKQYGFPAHAIVTMADILQYLREEPAENRLLTPALEEAILNYYETYGAEEYRSLFQKGKTDGF